MTPVWKDGIFALRSEQYDSDEGGRSMRYEVPSVRDFGSIAGHTFTNTGQVPGVGPKGKDWRTCDLDKFDEESCGSPH